MHHHYKDIKIQWLISFFCQYNIDLIKNSQAVKKGAAPIKAMVKKDVKSKVGGQEMAVMVG